MKTFDEVFKEHKLLTGIFYSEIEEGVARVFYYLGITEALKQEIDTLEKEVLK